MSDRPLMIFDGECGFCRRWIACWRRLTGPKIRYRSYQRVHARFPEIPLSQFEEAVYFIEPNRRSRGAEAVFRCLAYVPGYEWMLRLYLQSRIVRFVTNRVYGWIARHRLFASRWMKRLRLI